MTTPRRTRTLALGLAALTLGAGGLTAAGAITADAEAAAPRPARTALTFAVDDCEGCRVQLHQGFDTGRRPQVWDSVQRTVRDGRVTFPVLTRRTWGMTVTVRAPWEGHTGYLTTVAFRYAGKRVGQPVTLRQARRSDAASACWAGTRQDSVTVPLVVERVRVAGVREQVAGSIAYTPTTEDWAGHVRTAWDGVLGSQDVDLCGQR